MKHGKPTHDEWRLKSLSPDLMFYIPQTDTLTDMLHSVNRRPFMVSFMLNCQIYVILTIVMILLFYLFIIIFSHLDFNAFIRKTICDNLSSVMKVFQFYIGFSSLY